MVPSNLLVFGPVDVRGFGRARSSAEVASLGGFATSNGFDTCLVEGGSSAGEGESRARLLIARVQSR